MTKPIPTRPMPLPTPAKSVQSVQSVQSHAPVATVAPALPVAPAHAPRSVRVFTALQLPDARPQPSPELLRNSELLLAPHLPQLSQCATPHAREETQGANGSTVQTAATGSTSHLVASGNGLPALSVEAGRNLPVLSVEAVLRAELGHANARARAFLTQWLSVRRYRAAWELAGCAGSEVALWKTCSPSFQTIFDSVDAYIRTHRHHEAEDTLHALANGEKRKVKTVTDADGATVTTDEGEIYDTKALALELAAQDRARYGGGSVGGGTAIQVNISVTRPDWAGDARQTQAAPGATVEAVEWIEA